MAGPDMEPFHSLFLPDPHSDHDPTNFYWAHIMSWHVLDALKNIPWNPLNIVVKQTLLSPLTFTPSSLSENQRTVFPQVRINSNKKVFFVLGWWPYSTIKMREAKKTGSDFAGVPRSVFADLHWAVLLWPQHRGLVFPALSNSDKLTRTLIQNKYNPFAQLCCWLETSSFIFGHL